MSNPGTGRPGLAADIGIILLDADISRPVGDIGNAATFGYPVSYQTASGAFPKHVVEREAAGLLDGFVRAGRRLLDRGARAITTSCGFLAVYQHDMATTLDGIVATSALLQIPLVLRMLNPASHVGLITANAAALGQRHLDGSGISAADRDRLTIVGLESTHHFYPVIVEGARGPLDTARAEDEVVTAARTALTLDPAIAAFVLECSNLPPYAAAIRAATGLPVWDITTMVDWIAHGIAGARPDWNTPGAHGRISAGRRGR
jgi:hypothetical protein